MLLHFKLSKSGQVLHVDKTGFPRPVHICKFLWSITTFSKLSYAVISHSLALLATFILLCNQYSNYIIFYMCITMCKIRCSSMNELFAKMYTASSRKIAFN